MEQFAGLEDNLIAGFRRFLHLRAQQVVQGHDRDGTAVRAISDDDDL